MGVVQNGRDPYSNVPEVTRQQDEGRDDIPGPHISTGRISYLIGLFIVGVALGYAMRLMA